MTEKQKQLVQGIIRTIIVCSIGGVIMYILGDWQSKKWLIFLSVLVLPYYFVYKIYWVNDKEDSI